jgi:hypothetical protein
VSGALPSYRIDPLAERDRCLREIARLEAILAEHPHCCRTPMLLEHERGHLERVESTLRACGWEPS